MDRKRKRAAIYARVSTRDQDPDLQLRELESYAENRGFEVVGPFADRESGTSTNREELNRLWKLVRARKVDLVLVWKFDRFARSMKQLVDALEEFQHLGVDFVSLTEQIDTSSPAGKLVFHVMSAIAEFERELISERVRAGIAKARAQGKVLGRPRIDEKVAEEIRRLHRQEKLSLREVGKRLSVSKSTVENYA